jgi:hypothetical protein
VGKQRVYIEEKERDRKKGESGKDIQQQQFCKQTTSIKCNSANVIFIFATLASKIANSSRQIRRFLTPK